MTSLESKPPPEVAWTGLAELISAFHPWRTLQMSGVHPVSNLRAIASDGITSQVRTEDI